MLVLPKKWFDIIKVLGVRKMAIIKAILIFFLMFLTIGKVLQLFENNLEFKYELLYILEVILSIVGTIILFKI